MLDSSPVALGCTLSQQLNEFNKINHLAQIGVQFMLRRST
jgi:hypothetical protein